MSQSVLLKKRVETFDAEEGRWVTTENGNHIHIDKNGNPDKGNPKVLEAAKKKGKSGAKGGGERKNAVSNGVKKMTESDRKRIKEGKKSKSVEKAKGKGTKSEGKSGNNNQAWTDYEKERNRPKTKEEAEKIIEKVIFPREGYRGFLDGSGSSHGGKISWQDAPGMFDDKTKFKPGWHDWHGNYLSEGEVLELVKSGGWGVGYT